MPTKELVLADLSAKELAHLEQANCPVTDGQSELSDIQIETINAYRKANKVKLSQEAAALNVGKFGNLPSTDKLTVTKELIIESEKAKDIKPRVFKGYGRIGLSTDQPDRKATEGDGYKDYSDLPWRIKFSHLIDTTGEEFPFVSQLDEYGVSFNRENKKSFAQWSMLEAGDVIGVEIETDTKDGYKHYGIFDAFARMILGSNFKASELLPDVQMLWDDHKVVTKVNGENRERVVMHAPAREDEWDLNSSNFATPKRLKGEDLVKAQKLCKDLTEFKNEAKKSKDAAKLAKTTLNDRKVQVMAEMKLKLAAIKAIREEDPSLSPKEAAEIYEMLK